MRDVAPLFRPLHAELLALLRGLGPEEWTRPTVAGAWRVHDVAAHLLDGDLRNLAAHRDRHFLTTGSAPETYGDVVQLINTLNAGGVAYGARLSPRLLADLLDVSGVWVADFIAGLDPRGPALYPVAWAGEAESQNWMDTGREYTERWHHQMQIRDAVGAPLLLLEERWYEPLLDFSTRALPRAYEAVDAADGTAIHIHVDAWSWTLLRRDAAWHLQRGAAGDANAIVRMPADVAWRVFYNAPHEPVQIEGDATLGAPLLRARSVMV
jgi:hypothetical protein